MKEHLLRMDTNPAKMSWKPIPDDLWQNLLKHFVIRYTNRIGFSGIENADVIRTIEAFQDWQPKYISNCTLTYSWDNKLGQPLKLSYNLTMFNYTKEVHRRLSNTPFDAWNATSDSYPVDELFFFNDEKLLFHTVHYESWITFYDLTENQLKTLYAADKRIAANMYESNETEIEIECQ